MIGSAASIDAWTSLGLGMVQLAGDEVDFGTYEDVVRVALCAVVAPGVAEAVEVLPSSEDKGQLVPMLRSWVAPRDLVPSLILEESVGDGQLVERAQLQKSLPVLVHLADSKAP